MDQAGIALVDLSSGPAKQEEQPHNWGALDEEHFRSHPGLTVLQMAWHPGAEEQKILHFSQKIPSIPSDCASYPCLKSAAADAIAQQLLRQPEAQLWSFCPHARPRWQATAEQLCFLLQAAAGTLLFSPVTRHGSYTM